MCISLCHKVWSTSLLLPTFLAICTFPLPLSNCQMQCNESMQFWDCHPCEVFEQLPNEFIWEDCFCISKPAWSCYRTAHIFCTSQWQDHTLQQWDTSFMLTSISIILQTFSPASHINCLFSFMASFTSLILMHSPTFLLVHTFRRRQLAVLLWGNTFRRSHIDE